MDVFALTATLSLQADNFFSGLAEAAEAIIQFGSESLETSMTFDKSMSHVKAISGQVSGSVDQQKKIMEQLTQTAKEMGLQFETSADNTETAMNIINAKAAALGHDTMFTAAEVGDAFGYMAMAGWDYQEMLDGIDAVVSLAAASGEDLARTSDIVTDAITAFGYSASDATHFADVLAVTSARSNTNVGMMGETFKYVANEAGSYGWSLDEVAESIGLIANSGVKASMAGTALANVMRRITTNTSEARDLIEETLGVEVFAQDRTNAEWQEYYKLLNEGASAGAVESAYNKAYRTGVLREWGDIVEEVREKWQTLGDVDKAEYAKTIAGAYGSKAFKALMNATEEDIESIRNGIINSEGASQDMMDIMTDNLWGDIKRYESAFDAVKRTIGEELTPMARDFTQYGTESWDTLLNAYGEGGLDLLPEALHVVIQKGSDLINEYLPTWKENGTKIMETISAGIREASPILGEVISTFGGMIGTFLADNAPTIVSTVSTVAKAMAPGVIAAFQGIFQGLTQALPEIWKNISSDFTGFIGGLLWQMEDSMPLVAHALEGLLGIESKSAHDARVAYEAELAASAQAAETFVDNVNNLEPAQLVATFDDQASEPIQYAREIFDDFLAYNNSEAGIASAFTDNSTTPINLALEYINDILAYNGTNIETLSTFVDESSDPALQAIVRLQELSDMSQKDYKSFSEHSSEVPELVQTILEWLRQLEGEQGEISHTSSVHDQITNVITNYITDGQKTGVGATENAQNKIDKLTKGDHNRVVNARSMFDGTILRGATMFGWDAQGRPQIGGGEGPEAVVGVNSLNEQIRGAVRDGLSGIMGAIAQAIGGRNEQPVYVVLDTGELVGAIGGKMDAELGKIGDWKGGGRA